MVCLRLRNIFLYSNIRPVMKKRMEVEQMLTTNEVAARLNITPARVRQMVTAGVIRGEKYGRDVLIPESQVAIAKRSEEHTSELQSLRHLVCRLLLEKKKKAH